MSSPSLSRTRNLRVRIAAFAAALLSAAQIALPQAEHLPSGPWADWAEPYFPFFSSVLDARKIADDLPGDNLTPRGLVLNLGHDLWACFDVDLLRVSAIWQGKGVKPEALAPLSYHDAGLKTLDGQTKLPAPDGEVWLANSIYPGWQIGRTATAADPRSPTPTPGEVGRGALPPDLGRFDAVRLTRGGLCLEYHVGETRVREWLTGLDQDGVRGVERRFRVEPAEKPLQLVVASAREQAAVKITGDGARRGDNATLSTVVVPPHKYAVEFRVTLSRAASSANPNPPGIPTDADQPPAPRWPQVITTKAALSPKKEAYVLDEIPLPLDNPWKRNVRICDVEFFKDGTAAAVTLDGDVWMIRGLVDKSGEVQWRRFASGLHEPMSCAIRDGDLFVYDRNGIWRLRDTNNDGEADVHELFSNAFAQTAETREFPSSMKLAPDGSFVISKGGQQSSTMGRDNGTVLRVSRDGRSVEVLGWGFRGPFIGVNPRTGLVTASDQEGNYVPTTPLYIVAGAEYHGFLSQLLPKEEYPAPIADPLVWIPHPVNSSAVTQAWLTGAKMGPLNDSMLHLGYTRPEIFLVRMSDRFKKAQAFVMSLTHEIEFPLLNGAVNPADGQLYLAGFRGWGTVAPRLAGLARLRYTGAPALFPSEVVGTDQGVLLRFDSPLDEKRATDLANYSVERWNYKRTWKYGSPHLKLDGKPGQDWMQPSSVYLSKDARSVLLGLPGMRPVMQMRVGWSLTARNGAASDNNAYFTPHELAHFDAEKEGFGKVTVDLTPKAAVATASGPVSVEEGRRVYQMFGCMACHSTDGSMLGKVGPSWKGLFGSKREFTDKTSAIADEAYLRQSITDPSAKVIRGFEKLESGMPIYGGVLSDSQIDSVIAFIKTLAGPAPAGGGKNTKSDSKGSAAAKGQRVFTCGHSFHVFVYRLVAEMAKSAGIADHGMAGLSSIGGSRVIQHWDAPDEKNLAKAALRDGEVDVLTLSPIWLPDEGIENFAKLALEHNPSVRIAVQEFWLPNDTYHPVYPLETRLKIDHDATDVAELRRQQGRYDHDVDEYVREINRRLGKEIVFTVPVGQAAVALREKIVAGQAPGLKAQWEIFRDNWGHPKAPLQVLDGYCHFAVIYRRSPVGLPVPSILEKAEGLEEKEKLNRLLQELAWDAVIHHPLSGVKAK